ncbi:MAG: YHYH protein [Pseudomonadota bacterium]
MLVAVMANASFTVGHLSAYAANPDVKIYDLSGQRCIESNGVPNHKIGQFPNAGNPNSFQTQSQKYCFDLKPKKTNNATLNTPIVGIALNGIVIRPGTADWYDQSSPRGFSRDSASGWNLEGIGSAEALGMDGNNAHVDNRGVYHYHGVPVGLLEKVKSTHIGYAADGFEIHYVGKNAIPSYVLKAGTRPTKPGGNYDGRFVEDWEFKKGHGNLDQCNGALLNGNYVYFATDSYPFYPRCHWGNVSSDFQNADPRSAARPVNSQGGRGGPLAAAARELGVTERALAEAVGPPPPNIKRASQMLGIDEARLRSVLKKHRPR